MLLSYCIQLLLFMMLQLLLSASLPSAQGLCSFHVDLLSFLAFTSIEKEDSCPSAALAFLLPIIDAFVR